jgi:hypothetical protein
MYPRNNASPLPIALGAIHQISDGAIQTSGASVRVKTGTGSWGAGAGTLSCDTTSGTWEYTPTQGETDAASFIVSAYKASCTVVSKTVITTASATAGYAGLDWGKVTNATSTVGLSGTTVKAVTDAVTFPSSATINITGNITGNVSGSVGSVTGAVGSIGSGGITSGSFASGAIDASAIATDAITSAELSSSAVGEIVSGVWDALLASHTTAGTFGARLLRSTNSNAEVQVTGSNHVAADLHESQPGSVHATTFDAGAIDAAALAADAASEIASAVRTNLTTELGRIDVAVSTRLATSAYTSPPSANTIADTVLGRSMSNVEATAAEHSICTLVLGATESAVSGLTWTIYRTDGTTTYRSKTITTDGTAEPIVSVS